MERTEVYLVGMAVGILLVAICLIIKKKKTGKGAFCDFDERQELIRGRAFKYGFFTLLIYFGVYSCLEMVNIHQDYFDAMTITFMGLCIGVTVFACYAIWHDAYFSMQDKPALWTLTFAALSVLNLIGGFLGLSVTDASQSHGILGENSMNFCVGSMSAVLVIAVICKQIKNREQGEDE